MIAVRVVRGSGVVAEIRIEAVADGTTVELVDSATVEAPAPAAPPPPGLRTWRAGFAWTALGVTAILAGNLLDASFWSPWNHTRWVTLFREAITSALALPLAAGALFLVLKVIGRRVRMADTLRTLALLAWLAPALSVASLAGYYLLSPSQLGLFEGALVAVTVAVGLAVLASVRREPRSLAFTSGWAAAVLVVIVGLATIAAMNSEQRGEPSVDLRLQAPLAGYAGRAESLDDYFGAVRSAAQSSEGGRRLPDQIADDPNGGGAAVAAGPTPELRPRARGDRTSADRESR